MSHSLAVWIGAFFTLCILSFLYRDNPFFRFAESAFAGVSLGYYIGNTFDQTLVPNLFLPLRPGAGTSLGGTLWLIFGMAVGVMLYARYVKKTAALSRWALAIYVGYYMGIQMMQKLQGEVQPQAAETILSLGRGAGGVANWISSVVTVAGVFSVLVYFFFSAEHRGPVGRVSRLGVWFLMVSFGAAFGYTIMGRVSVLIGRVTFLLTEWMGIG